MNVYDGFVDYVAHMGDDKYISMIAGISHGSETGPGVDKLIEWKHVSPLEFAQIVFHVKCPIFVARHFMRHRSCTFMEMSGRYCDLSKTQGYIPIAELAEEYELTYQNSYDRYCALLKAGASREIARIVLPLGMYTEFYVRFDLRHFRDFCELRLDKSAQEETRAYAQEMLEIAKCYFPQTLKDIGGSDE